MLRLLRVRNFALIDELTLEFHPGLNVLTGETGAGKSLVVDALSLIAGSRASTELIRGGEERAVVEVVADIGGLSLDLARFGLDDPEGHELVIRREIASDDRNRVFIDNQPATVSTLRAVAPLLLDIHGQHEQQTLLAGDTQLALIDQACGTQSLRHRVRKLGEQIRAHREELATLDSREAEILQRQDLLAFQRREIESVAPEAEETERLRLQVQVLEHSGRLLERAGSAYEALYESDGSILEHLSSIERSLESETRHDPRLEPILAQIQAGRTSLTDASWELREYLNQFDINPGEIGQLQARLSELERLERKYGPDLPAYLETVRQELDSIGLREEKRSNVIAQLGVLDAQRSPLLGELSEARRSASEALSTRVSAELRTLAMPEARFWIEWRTLEEASLTGIDRPLWYLAPNAGEEGSLLSAIASGGELSRTMLAIRSVLARNGDGRTLVFDEIDAGIGGEAAEGVGLKLRELAESYQVLSVTHLPQIARFGDHHVQIGKTVRSGRTITEAEVLSGEARIEELARMMSGKRVTEAARRHVRELLEGA